MNAINQKVMGIIIDDYNSDQSKTFSEIMTRIQSGLSKAEYTAFHEQSLSTLAKDIVLNDVIGFLSAIASK